MAQGGRKFYRDVSAIGGSFRGRVISWFWFLDVGLLFCQAFIQNYLVTTFTVIVPNTSCFAEGILQVEVSELLEIELG